MPVQPHLFPDTPPSPTGPPPPDPENRRGAIDSDRGAPLWLQRLSLFVLVLFCVYLGVILTVLPWWGSVWDHNLFLTTHPHLWALLRTGAARGIISGIGLLDIWIGISEAVHYRDHRP